MEEPVKTEDELWVQVNQDRATRAAEGDQPVVADAPAEDTDPLAAFPEPTRKLIQGLDEQVRKSNEQLAILDRKFGKANGIIGNLQQRLDESQAKLKAVDPIIEANEAAKKTEAEAAAAEREQKRKAARDEAMELAPAFVEYVDLTLADAKPAVPAKEEVKPLPAATPAEDDTVRILSLQLELSDRAPGWRKTKDLPEFNTWLASQPEDVRNTVNNSFDVDALASVFHGFEKHKQDAATVAQVEQDRKARLNRGSSIQGRGSSVGNVDLSEDAAWEKVKRDREKSRASA